MATLPDRARVLIVHMPKIAAGINEIMVMPMGLFPISRALRGAGYDVEIVHFGIEKQLDPSFSVLHYIERQRPLAVLLDLHWHHQTFSVLAAAQRIKRLLPHTAIVLGGLTASCFHREIIEQLPFVDYVIRGDGERPAQELLHVLTGEGRVDEVPNLTWRNNGDVRETPFGFRTGTDHAWPGHVELESLRHHEAYLSTALYGDFNERAGSSHQLGAAFYYNPGRGCTSGCVYCGGSAAAQRATSDRRGAFFYPFDKLAEDIERMQSYGVHTLRTSFDPDPERGTYLELMAHLCQVGYRPRMVFDLWSLPTPAFVRAFAETFAPSSILVLSPESGSAEVRRRTRGFSFSNEDVMDGIRLIEDAGLEAHAFFTAGLPFEGEPELAETASLISRIRHETHAEVSVAPVELDPGSPMHRHPERYGVTLRLNTLRDFYEAHRMPSAPGFGTALLSEPAILEAVERLRKCACT